MPESQRPNIVLIMVDDADRKVLEHQACAGIRAAIANQGATATRYLINHPLCGPSRASFLRGKYPHNTGVVGNSQAYANFEANGGEDDNVAVWFHAAGYSTAMIGKYLNGYKVGPNDLHRPPGWDYWFAVGKNAYDSWEYDVNDNGVHDDYGSELEDPDNYLTDVLATKAVGFLDSNLAAEPFLLIVNPMAPHSPSNPAPRHGPPLYSGEMYPTGPSVPSNPSFNEDDVTDKPWYISMLPKLQQGQINTIHERYRDRLRCMRSVADLVEDIIEKLDEIDPGLANTYVFFTSDHGFHMGEHRLGQDELQDEYEVPTPGGKNTMYEEDIRVPLWVRGPGITPGSTITTCSATSTSRRRSATSPASPRWPPTSTGARSCRCCRASR